MTDKLVRHAGSIVDHILEQPELVLAVRNLEAPVLKRLIEHVGLEDAGDLVALASTEQLERVFDEDLWASAQPGEDARFDAARFGLWLAVLVQQGVGLAARRLAELDADLVTLALCRLVLVIDVDQLAQQMSAAERSDEDDALDKQLESSLYHEFEQYRVIARDSRHWDELLAVLVELNQSDYATLERLLERCCAITNETIEDNGGLYEVLTAEEAIADEVAGERAERREAQGYVAESNATAFLKLARTTQLEQLLADDEPDPITRAHFRRLEPQASAQGERGAGAPSRATPGSLPTTQRSPDTAALLGLLRETGVLAEQAPRKRLTQGAPQAGRLLQAAMQALREAAPLRYDERMLEAAYLANVVLAGIGTRARRLRPAEAAEAALAISELGARALVGAGRTVGARHVQVLGKALARTSLVKLFRVGFQRLCTEPDLALAPQLGTVCELLRARGWLEQRPRPT